MSLINQMLQDLDARAGRPGAAPLPEQVRVVSLPRPGLPWRRVALLAASLLFVGVAWLLGMRLLATPPGLPKAAPGTVTVAQAAAPVVNPSAPVKASSTPPAPVSAPVVLAPSAPEPVALPVAVVTAPTPAPTPVPAPAVKATAQPAALKLPAKPAASVAHKADLAPSTVSGKTETAAQRVDNTYRRALAALEDGRMIDAIAGLQAVLRLDPHHEAARQTLVGLLVEAGRSQEAMQQLQSALTLDARQPAMALLLARLQLEHGGPVLDTLTRSLPYANGNGDYHAFFGGVLQRHERYREAAEQYQAALKGTPANGVWWMGLGMALQADMRGAEAAQAFARAQADATLTPQLRAFVERRLRQLGQ